MPTTIHLPGIEDGSIDLGGTRAPVVKHLVVVDAAQVGTVLRNQPGSEIVPDAAPEEE